MTDDLRTRVRAAVKASGVKQAAIAARLGVSEKHLSQMLTGRVRLTVPWADKILAECGSELRFTIHPGTPPTGPAGASSANRPTLPTGPALVYVAPDGTTTPVDETAVTSHRDRALCRALLGRAATVLDEAEAQQEKHPVGFQGSGVIPLA